MSRASAKDSSSRQKRLSPMERAIIRYDEVRDPIAKHHEAFLDAVEDPDDPCTGLSFVRRDDGGFLAIIKRQHDLTDQVMMAYGEDWVTAMQALDKKLRVADWKVDTPWKPPKNSS